MGVVPLGAGEPLTIVFPLPLSCLEQIFPQGYGLSISCPLEANLPFSLWASSPQSPCSLLVAEKLTSASSRHSVGGKKVPPLSTVFGIREPDSTAYPLYDLV